MSKLAWEGKMHLFKSLNDNVYKLYDICIGTGTVIFLTQ